MWLWWLAGARFAAYGANWIAALLSVQSIETRQTKIRALMALRTGLGSIYGTAQQPSALREGTAT